MFVAFEMLKADEVIAAHAAYLAVRIGLATGQFGRQEVVRQSEVVPIRCRQGRRRSRCRASRRRAPEWPAAGAAKDRDPRRAEAWIQSAWWIPLANRHVPFSRYPPSTGVATPPGAATIEQIGTPSAKTRLTALAGIVAPSTATPSLATIANQPEDASSAARAAKTWICVTMGNSNPPRSSQSRMRSRPWETSAWTDSEASRPCSSDRTEPDCSVSETALSGEQQVRAAVGQLVAPSRSNLSVTPE